MKFNLLIKFVNGEEKIIRDVEDYTMNKETKCFTFAKKWIQRFCTGKWRFICWKRA